MVSYFDVSIIKRTLAWTTGSLTCGVCDLFASVCTQGISVILKHAWCLTSTEIIRLIRDGERERENVYQSLRCHHQNDSCIKMGSDKSHFNVSLIVRDKVTRQCPHTTTFEEKGEPKRNRTEVLVLTRLTPYH